MESQRPSVSIVIPTYNHGPLLKEALESVRAQTVTDWEAIVVNNHSTDNTISVVNAFQDPRIRLINYLNHGIIAASRNEGVRHSRADLIAFLDSDDVWYPSKLERCVASLTPEADVVCHGEKWTKDGTPYLDIFYGPSDKADFLNLLFTGNCLSTSAILLRKAAFVNAGGFREDPSVVTAEDYDLWTTLARTGSTFVFLNELLGEYRLHEANETRLVQRHLSAVLKVFEHQYALLQNHNIGTWSRRRVRRSRLFSDASRRSLQASAIGDALRYAIRSIAEFPLIPFLLILPGVRFIVQRAKARP